MPPKVLNDCYPFELMFKKMPDYIYIKILGYQCFPYKRPYNNNKLQPRLAKCVFIGYVAKYHGYIVLIWAKN